MDRNKLIALLAAADALPVVYGLDYEGSEDRDAYGRAVDVLDSLGLIEVARENRIGEPFETLKVGDVSLSSPRGFTPVTDRVTKQPTETLAERTVDATFDENDQQANILLERIVRCLTSGESAAGTMNAAERIKAGIALGRLLRHETKPEYDYEQDRPADQGEVVDLSSRRNATVFTGPEKAS